MTTTTKPRSKGRKTTSAARVDVYQQVTDRVIEALEAGTAPWRQPWNVDHGMPLSLSTRKPYRGVNVLLLGLAAQTKGYSSPWWGTYKRIVELGGKVRTVTCDGPRCKACGGSMTDLVEGHLGLWCEDCGGTLDARVRAGVRERATHVIFWKTFQSKEIDETTGKPRTGMILRSYPVFNSEQADWQPGKAPVVPDYSARTPGERIEAAEAIAAGYPDGPTVRTNGPAAFYSSALDTITVPSFESFGNPEEYYSTLFHEMGHSTGHTKRLNRPGVAQFDHFGSDRYGKEELVAEMTAAMLDGLCGFTLAEKFDNSAAYLQNWLDAIHEDRKLIVLAAAAAQKAADHIMGVTWEPDTATEPAPDSEEN